MIFAYGKNSKHITDNKIAVIQTLSGTGACRVAGEFLHRNLAVNSILLPNPTWANHNNIFQDAHITPHYYPYYDINGRSVDFNGIRKSIAESPKHSWFLFHVAAHNPTGNYLYI